MKKLTIKQRIKNKHIKIRQLVVKWEMANELDDVDKYLEYTYYIAMTIRQIKWLKRLAKINAFWKKLLKDIG
jgi:hypothetical protein